ncbi:MAG: alanine racemase [Clostridia bacterium]|nr:alanine racemase [Clostridia bacterium]
MKQKNSATISRAALLSNYAAVDSILTSGSKKAGIRKPKIICVVKADAYGHGIAAVSSALGEAGCDFFAVSSEDEAVELRELELRCGRHPEILILGHVMPENVDEMIARDITCAAVSPDNARELSEAAAAHNRRGRRIREDSLKIHIKLDTGMNRVGFAADPDRLAGTVEDIEAAAADPNLTVSGIFTHFACADDELMDGQILPGCEDCGGYTMLQLGRYRAAVDALTRRGIDVGLRHCANSAAALTCPDAYFDAVRAGVVLYGLMPDGKEDPRFRPAMRFDSTVVHVHRLAPGERVSYGAEFTAERPTVLATVGAGYADGFERAYRGCAVKIGGLPYRQVGRICMDQFMADVTEPIGKPAPSSPPAVGEPVTLFGGDSGESVNALARTAGTINYEVVCKVSKRVPRIVE